MSDYSFITQWWFDAPIDRVWGAIRDAGRWPSWWRSVVSVEPIAAGDAAGVGEVRRFTWRGRLPYTLTFDMKTTRVEPPTALDGIATGELEGEGRWRLASESGATVANGRERAIAHGHERTIAHGRERTIVRYDWDVRATKRWMRLLAPVARPLFSWNHDAVMKDGERGLRRLLAERP